MDAKQTTPPRHDERREWVRPVLQRINAGSAENDVGPNNDLSVNVS